MIHLWIKHGIISLILKLYQKKIQLALAKITAALKTPCGEIRIFIRYIFIKIHFIIIIFLIGIFCKLASVAGTQVYTYKKGKTYAFFLKLWKTLVYVVKTGIFSDHKNVADNTWFLIRSSWLKLTVVWNMTFLVTFFSLKIFQ